MFFQKSTAGYLASEQNRLRHSAGTECTKSLLQQTNEPLAQIAQEAGVADQSHLTSILRREIGVTPGRFRAALA